MSTFGTDILHQEYATIAARGDPLNEIHDLIDWDLFRPRLSTLYASDRNGSVLNFLYILRTLSP